MAVKKQAKNKAKSNAGRPTVITPEVSAKLQSAFSVGANNGEACRFAGISEDAFSRALKNNPEFSGKIEQMKLHLPLKAKSEMVTAAQRRDKPTRVRW